MQHYADLECCLIFLLCKVACQIAYYNNCQILRDIHFDLAEQCYSNNKMKLQIMIPIAIPELLSFNECEVFVKESEAPPYGCEEAYGTSHIKVAGLYNTIEDHDMAATIFERIAPFIPEHIIPGWTAVGVNESFRILKYLVGEDFPVHVDPDYSRPYGHPQYGEVSFLTLIVYLNGDFCGGHTVFYDDAGSDKINNDNANTNLCKYGSECNKIKPATGTAVMFKHDTYHASENIESGVKYALRTDVMFTMDPL